MTHAMKGVLLALGLIACKARPKEPPAKPPPDAAPVVESDARLAVDAPPAAPPSPRARLEEAMRSDGGPLAELTAIRSGMTVADAAKVLGPAIADDALDPQFVARLRCRGVEGPLYRRAIDGVILELVARRDQRLAAIRVHTMESLDAASKDLNESAPERAWWRDHFELAEDGGFCVDEGNVGRGVALELRPLEGPTEVTLAPWFRELPSLLRRPLAGTTSAGVALMDQEVVDPDLAEVEHRREGYAELVVDGFSAEVHATVDAAGTIVRVEASLESEHDSDRKRMYQAMVTAWGKPTATISDAGRFALRFRAGRTTVLAEEGLESWNLTLP
jgi:hypothetical protein